MKSFTDPARMSARDINKALDALDTLDSQFTQAMIDAGRGYERPSEYLEKTDPLSQRLLAVFQERMRLRAEMANRYGPDVPSRLPTHKRGAFGPIAK